MHYTVVCLKGDMLYCTVLWLSSINNTTYNPVRRQQTIDRFMHIPITNLTHY